MSSAANVSNVIWVDHELSASAARPPEPRRFASKGLAQRSMYAPPAILTSPPCHLHPDGIRLDALDQALIHDAVVQTFA